MGKLFTAISVTQYAKLLHTKKLPAIPFEDGDVGLQFTEDKSYWIQELKNQEDLENVIDYKLAVVIEFEIEEKVLNSLIESKQTSRLGKKIVTYYKSLSKPIIIPELTEEDRNILCIIDIYESQETSDGISQKWLLKVTSEESDIWLYFTNSINKIACIGAIPGAIEESKRLI